MERAIELADLLVQLRGELSRAMWSGENSDIRFVPGTIQLELTFEVERAASAEGKVRFWVLDGSAGLREKSTTTQKITLSLEPRLAADPSRSPLISGTAMPDET